MMRRILPLVTALAVYHGCGNADTPKSRQPPGDSKPRAAKPGPSHGNDHHATGRSPSPPHANAYIISPKHGEVLYNPVTVRFGLKGMGIAPIGDPSPNSGHFHIWLNEPLPRQWNQPLVFGDHYLHFSAGETQTTLDLSPGQHTLQLIMADHSHMPHDPPVYSQQITVTVIPYSDGRK